MNNKNNKDKNTNTTWLSSKELAGLARITARAARKALSGALRSKHAWKGALLEVRNIRGGSLEVCLDSLPSELKEQWRRLQAATVEDVADSELPTALAKWSDAEREQRHEEFSKLPASVQHRARRAVDAVSTFHLLAQGNLPKVQRYVEVAKEFDLCPRTVRAWVAKCVGVHRGDWHIVLAPNYKSDRPRAPISPEALHFIEDEYLQLTKPALHPIYRRAVRLAAERDWALPSYWTVQRLIDQVPLQLRILKREGSDAFDRLFAKPRDYSDLKLHELWCGDGHKVDFWVRMDDGSIVRPIIMSWMDCRSRLICGYSIELVESAEGAMRSFRAAAANTKAIPEACLIDNGRAYASKLFTGGAVSRNRFKIKEDEESGVLTLLGVAPSFIIPGNSRANPLERYHQHLAEMARRFPGAYVGNRPGARPEDCDKSKAASIDQLRSVLEETIEDYHSSPHRGDAMHGRSPRQVYEELWQTATVRQPTQAQLRLCLMARKRVKLSNADHGIEVHGNRYWSEKLLNLSPAEAYVAAYDPEDAKQPVMLYAEERFICEVPLIARTGFRSQEAAKERARESSRAKKAIRALDAARRGMRQASSWIAPPAASPDEPSSPSIAESLSPAKVTKLVTPRLDHRKDEKREGGWDGEEVMRALMQGLREGNTGRR